jgi:transposase
MAYGYMQRDREQLFLPPPSMLDWLEEGHPAYFLIDAVGLLDTSAFHEAHPTEGAGRSAYDPEMMLTALLYAYTTGMRSSRAIEAACRSDLAFRVICVNLVPHFTTIARFRAENEAAIRRSSSGS